MTSNRSLVTIITALSVVGAAGAGAGAAEAPAVPAGMPASAPAPAPGTPAPAGPVAAEKKKPATALYATGGGGGILDERRGAAVGSLTLTRPVGGFFAVEIAVGAGWAASGPKREDLLWARMAVGARFEPTRAAVRPWGALRATHIHMATLGTWIEHPGHSLAGSSQHGLGHRSGLAVAGGISAAVPWTHEHLRVTAGAEMMWIAIGAGPRWVPTAELGFGWSF